MTYYEAKMWRDSTDESKSRCGHAWLALYHEAMYWASDQEQAEKMTDAFYKAFMSSVRDWPRTVS